MAFLKFNLHRYSVDIDDVLSFRMGGSMDGFEPRVSAGVAGGGEVVRAFRPRGGDADVGVDGGDGGGRVERNGGAVQLANPVGR